MVSNLEKSLVSPNHVTVATVPVLNVTLALTAGCNSVNVNNVIVSYRKLNVLVVGKLSKSLVLPYLLTGLAVPVLNVTLVLTAGSNSVNVNNLAAKSGNDNVLAVGNLEKILVSPNGLAVVAHPILGVAKVVTAGFNSFKVNKVLVHASLSLNYVDNNVTCREVLGKDGECEYLTLLENSLDGVACEVNVCAVCTFNSNNAVSAYGDNENSRLGSGKLYVSAVIGVGNGYGVFSYNCVNSGSNVRSDGNNCLDSSVVFAVNLNGGSHSGRNSSEYITALNSNAVNENNEAVYVPGNGVIADNVKLGISIGVFFKVNVDIALNSLNGNGGGSGSKGPLTVCEDSNVLRLSKSDSILAYVLVTFLSGEGDVKSAVCVNGYVIIEYERYNRHPI